MRKIETKPATQQSGEVLHKSQGCSGICFTAHHKGMILDECSNYHVKSKAEFCDNDESTGKNFEM